MEGSARLQSIKAQWSSYVCVCVCDPVSIERERRGEERRGRRDRDVVRRGESRMRVLVMKGMEGIIGVHCARRHGGRGSDDAALKVQIPFLLISQVVIKFGIIPKR